MVLADWTNLFYDRILSRGWNYFHDGSVRDLCLIGNTLHAQVIGSEEYEVSIQTRDGSIGYMECTCPFAENGENCKHMAAVLYAAEAADEIPLSDFNAPLPAFNTLSVKNEPDIDMLRQAISAMSQDALRKLILDWSLHDPKLRNRILSQQGHTLPQCELEALKTAIDEMTEQASDRHGYIDYDHAYDYAWELIAFLQDVVPSMVTGGDVTDAFRLTCYAFMTFAEQDIDDSDGGFQEVSGACQELWQAQLDAASPKQRTCMFDWFLTAQASLDFVDDELEYFRLTAFHDNDLLCQNLSMVDDQIAQLRERTDGASNSYYLSIYINHRLRLMAELGASPEELTAFREPYLYLHEVREALLETYMEQNNTADAIALLLKSLELDSGHIGYQEMHCRRLITLYEKAGMQDAWLRELEDYILIFRQNSLDYVHKLKKSLSKDEWQSFLPQLLTADTLHSYLTAFLAEEGLLQELMEVLEFQGSLDNILKYAVLLKSEFPKRLTACFTQTLQHQMELASNAKEYRMAVEYLTNLQRLPGGTESANALASKWRTAHPRRRSMLEALDKIGL